MQETHSTPDNELIWESEWGGKAFYSHGLSNARGIAIFVSKKLSPMCSNITRDVEGRYILLDIKENEQIITLAAIYAPNKDSPEFFYTLHLLLKERSEHKIMVGDFNLTMDVDLDRENTYANNNKALAKVEELCECFCLEEIWRIRNPEKREFSWKREGCFSQQSK